MVRSARTLDRPGGALDHRCLYGHRIPEQFTFAINQRTCPTCGAPCVTLDGYRLARRLTQEVPLEALAAFTVVRLLETNYTITAKPAEGADDSSTSQQIEVDLSSITWDSTGICDEDTYVFLPE